MSKIFHLGLDYSIIDNWIDMGCILQINRTSILGMHESQFDQMLIIKMMDIVI